MKKITALLGLSIIFVASIFAVEVDEDELKSTEKQVIEFINYTGPHKVIDSLEAIKEIGAGLGREIKTSVDKKSSTGSKEKYYVVHAIDPNEKGKFDADIIMLGENAGVDHIKNLRRIIASYLVSAYGYSEKDAETIAVFVTVYNAVYRGKLDTFKEKYKTIVTDNLTSSNCGLDVNWENWAGKSEIVIPLYDISGGLSTVDTSVISDTKVVESMKEDDDKNIEARKDMVDIKEREADDAAEKAQESQKKATEEQKKLDEEKQKTAEAQKKADDAQKKADDAQKKADEAQKKADDNPKSKSAQTKAEKAQDEADKAKAEAEKSKAELEEQKEAEAKQQEKVTEAKEEAKESQERADKKITEAQSERKEIAKDQNEVQQKQATIDAMTTEIGLTLVDEKALTSRLVKFNVENGKSIRVSPVTTIRNRTVYKSNDEYIAIAGDNSGKNSAVKLVAFDSNKLEIVNESEETVYENSVLVQDGSSYYCIVQAGKSWTVAKFGSDLKMQLRSSIALLPTTPITVTDSGIVVTNIDGKMVVLSKKDLKPVAGATTTSSSDSSADAK